MALVRAQDASSSSSNSSSCQFSYHVFLSFRGEDTRKTFTDHLYTALVGAGLSTFRDDDEIQRGENIKSELEKAISRSRSSIIVFSKDYASSSWCLDELLLILQCRKTSGLVVLPIFYDVDPSSIRKQSGSVSEAFVRHEERFKNEADDKERESWMKKVKEWRAALTEVANLGGMVLQNEADGYESKFIRKVVSVIGDKVTYNLLNVAPYLVGIDARVENINFWLRNGSTDVGIIAICGMGGVGKTTIAKYVFNMNFERFEYRSFLANIREISRQPDGLLRLQRQLLSDILNIKAKKINNADDGINKIKDAVCRGRVLIVLDDVDQISQLDVIFGMRDWFYPGSKIIVTTRNMQLLKVHEPCEMYAVEGMNFDESLELFSWHAFGDKHPAEGYLEHSTKIIMHCQGLPLALQVLGSSLRGKRVDVWISAMEKLKIIPHCQIQSILQISYESLQDDHDRDLFLEIACFFIGSKKTNAIGILDECNYHTIVGIENLVDRCLLTIDKGNKLRMHQLLQDMGREITRQQSPGEPGKRSRLWYYKDSFKVLMEKIGTKAIEGLALDMSMLTEDKSSMKRFNIYNAKKAKLKTDAFSMMHKLRLLQINYVQLTGDYKDFPKNLRWLCWHGFPLRSLPSEFPFNSLVAIDIQNSNLEELWPRKKFLGLLKFLNLSHCHRLVKTPDFSNVPALEELILKDCVNLVEIDESIGMAKGLLVLNLRDCSSLKKLPINIGKLKFIETLIISGCSNIHTFPIEEIQNMKSLKVFHADGIPFGAVTSTTRQNPSLLGFIWGLVSSPRKSPQLLWASLPRSLVGLSLVGCNLSENSFPRNFCDVSPLECLNLSRNPIRSLPDCFNGLCLKELCLKECDILQALTGISVVKIFRVQDCPLLEEITFRSNSMSKYYDLPYGCGKLVKLHNRFKLESVENIETEIINSLELYDLESLKSIRIKLYNRYTRTETEGPIQGVYDNFGKFYFFTERKGPIQLIVLSQSLSSIHKYPISVAQGVYDNFFNIFIRGDSIPNWFASRSIESSISFTVRSPQKAKVRCLNICFVYTIDEDFDQGFYIIVHNLSKDKKIVYNPSCYGIPEAGKYMIWLSQWKLRSHELEAGDELNVSLMRITEELVFKVKEFEETGSKVKELGFEVKEVGAHLVYDEDVDDDHVQAVDFQSNDHQIIPSY